MLLWYNANVHLFKMKLSTKLCGRFCWLWWLLVSIMSCLLATNSTSRDLTGFQVVCVCLFFFMVAVLLTPPFL
jgi:hypothetical protein